MPPGQTARYPAGTVLCRQTKAGTKDTTLPLNTLPDFAFAPFHALFPPVTFIVYFSGERSHEPKEHAGSCQVEVPAKNDPDLKFGALKDPVVPDNLAVEAEVARWMHKS